jgi:type IV pilus assembly protein PilM
VQRSISFFQSVDRTAKIGRVIPLGNAMKLRGLQKYLGQSLGYDVVELKEYRGLVGQGVVGTPAFRENLLSFGVCYGLALQGLRQASLRTNLIPPEIIQDRKMRAKKPWAVAAVASLLLGCTAGFFGVWRAYDSVQDNGNKDMSQALANAQQVVTTAEGFKTDYDGAKTQFSSVRTLADQLNTINDRRSLWPELLSAVAQCMPQDPPDFKLAADLPVPKDKLEDALKALVYKSQRIYIDQFDCEYNSNIKDWIAELKAGEGQPTTGAAATNTDSAPSTTPTESAAPAADSPTGNSDSEGWMIQLTGHHYHNLPANGAIGAEYVKQTLLKSLQNAIVTLPGPDGKPMKFPLKDLGIGNPVLLPGGHPKDDEVSLPGFSDRKGAPGDAGGPNVTVSRFDFVVQFAWRETPLTIRLQKAKSPQGDKKPAEGEKSPALAGGASATTAPRTN